MRFVALLGALLLVAGCFSTGPSEVQDVAYYQLSVEPAAPASGRSDSSVLLRPFSADEALEREGVRYLTSDVESGYWSLHLWSEPVSAMVWKETDRYIEDAGLFDKVLILDNAAAADYVLDGRIRRFEEVDREDGWYGVLDVSFELTRIDDGEVLFHKSFSDEEPCGARTVREVVRALSRALGRVLAKLATDLEKTVGRTGT